MKKAISAFKGTNRARQEKNSDLHLAFDWEVQRIIRQYAGLQIRVIIQTRLVSINNGVELTGADII